MATPVIMLIAHSLVVDWVMGSEGGADGHMPKPFSFEEPLARIRLRLRTEPEPARTTASYLEHRGLVLGYRTHRAQVDGQWVDLSAHEFTLTEVFLRNLGQVLSREQLLSNVWGFDFDPGSDIVDVYVPYPRNKLGKQRFETVWGVGCRLVRGERPQSRLASSSPKLAEPVVSRPSHPQTG